jgi:uncharacterized protein involved in exopolysaccharide biosynthesis
MNCPCCKLRQPRAIDRATGVSAQVCEQCGRHQGEQDAKRIKRAEDHQDLLRQRLAACTASEAKARADAEQAHVEAREAKRLEVEALKSRGRLALRIVRADGSGELEEIALDARVIAWAKRAEEDEPGFALGRL